ncbi:rab-like protein 3 isoform X2 [Pomacea canaliculata]|uniref:rab-like protein 3 isoform X2 n=1 Tax=Pomacea canaliculata TaxID=400727 RepID=UPI000D73BD11|nr:rab-like protein 3 isoform X2 [Pomacea canaliculata]
MAAIGAIEKAKVLVVGDSGVGKTSVVHLICHNEPCHNPSATIGCSVEVKLHEFRAGTPAERDYFLELWDIGGSSSHRNSRSIFYHQVHGIILVHDLTNRKSHQNLHKWLAEVLNKDTDTTNNGNEFDPETFAGNQIPILVIGTKADSAASLRETKISRTSSIAEECGADELHLDSMNTKYLAPGSTNAVKLTKFFDKVIERRYSGNQVSFGSKMFHNYFGD